MSRARTHLPFDIHFGRQKSGNAPWTLTLELARITGRGRELVRHVFSRKDLKHLRLTLVLLDADNTFDDEVKRTANPKG